MNTPRGSILVGYDGSGGSDLALSWADELARVTRRPLLVLISEVDPTQILEVTSDWHVTRMAQIEADVRGRLKDSPAPEPMVEIVDTAPAPAMINASREASLVVLGARGHNLFSGVVLGSVSQHVSRHAACPVVVVRQPHDPQARVVVGIDGSAGSRAALAFGFEQADRTGSSLTVIHAWRSMAHGRGAVMGAPFDERLAKETSVAKRILAEAVAGFAERFPDVALVTEAIPVAPSRCLVDASRSAALVVVGSRGRGAFAELMLGSVSQAVLHHAQCSVAVVR